MRPATLIAPLALAAAALTGGGGCSKKASFEEGDCVRIVERTLDAELRSAGCADAVGTFDDTARTYRVDSIIDDTDGGCPAPQGFFPVEFVDEPDGVTYCLVQQD
jgi:hypothetical protein